MTGGRRRRRVLVVAAALAGLALAACLGRGWLLPRAARALDVSAPPAPVDAVFVLGGGNETRPFAAAGLVRRGLAPVVLVPENPPNRDTDSNLVPVEHELVRRILAARGVPADAITILPGPCDSTADEARALGRYLDDHPTARVAVLTHTYHTRRARMLFRRQLGERMSRVTFAGVPTDGFTPESWWRNEGGFHTYVTEAGKLVATGLAGERPWQVAALAPVALLLAALTARRFRRPRGLVGDTQASLPCRPPGQSPS